MQLAVSADTTLWNYAFEHNVIITGEQNLFSLLRLLQIAWTQQHQAENQEKVFDTASALIERVQLFVERFEKIGTDIVEIMQLVVGTEDVIVVIEGEHSCMTARGIKKPGTVTRTATMRGAFDTDYALRQEFYNLIK